LFPSFINHQVFNGRTNENCDTTGTSTDAGYSEALFNFRVALLLRADLVALGARVVMTRQSNNTVGPCINRRAQLLNDAHVNVAIDIHADGAIASGRGFAILEPVADGPNNAVIASSLVFGSDVRRRMRSNTEMPISNYDGVNGVTFRSDLAGLNLATEPKVLIECGNMRNPTDAALLTSVDFRRRLATALAAAITDFLLGPSK
jgi:N-acetylmuramoyl-L-alanine amidase